MAALPRAGRPLRAAARRGVPRLHRRRRGRGELERVCREDTPAAEAWSPIFARAELKGYYRASGVTSVSVGKFWEDTQQYVYLPRLKSRAVLAAAVRAGGSSRDSFDTACGQSGGYEGFRFGEGEIPWTTRCCSSSRRR